MDGEARPKGRKVGMSKTKHAYQQFKPPVDINGSPTTGRWIAQAAGRMARGVDKSLLKGVINGTNIHYDLENNNGETYIRRPSKKP